jgi:hypothetical protein
MKAIRKVSPYLFEGYLIIALHADWIKVFGAIPTFTVSINANSKLRMISNEMIRK